VDQNVLDLVGLLYSYAYTHAVDTGFNQDLFVFIPGDRQGIEQDFGRAGGFYFGYIVSFRRLRSEVGKRKRRG
jgi:hypothetical protein